MSLTDRAGLEGALGELPGLKVTGMHPCAHLPSTAGGLVCWARTGPSLSWEAALHAGTNGFLEKFLSTTSPAHHAAQGKVENAETQWP